jgi:hypothetical protein
MAPATSKIKDHKSEIINQVPSRLLPYSFGTGASGSSGSFISSNQHFLGSSMGMLPFLALPIVARLVALLRGVVLRGNSTVGIPS